MNQGPYTPPVSDEWDAQPVSPSAPRRAGLMLWVLGGLEAVCLGFMSLMMFATMALPPTDRDKLIQEAAKQYQVSTEAVSRMFDALPMMGLAYIVFGVLPGLALVVLGFLVRKPVRWAATTAIVIVLAQAIITGFLLLNAVASAAMGGNPVMLTAGVVMFGTPLAIMVYTLTRLFASRKADTRY
ncbi:MAG: hypothetical protein GC164_04840 [Phycisphaera sp.]|nr:hypothetical protein [Phycisphaera sp.]